MIWYVLIVSLLLANDPPGCKNYYNAGLKRHIYTQVDEEPAFPGGEAEYARFLKKNLRFPEADSQELSTTATFTFIVDTSGEIKHAKILHVIQRELTPLEKEVLRVINSMPKWKPGTCNGKAVAVELKRPIVVCLGDS